MYHRLTADMVSLAHGVLEMQRAMHALQRVSALLNIDGDIVDGMHVQKQQARAAAAV